MADNPFAVNVPNAVQALLIGQNAYDAGQKRQKDQALADANQQAGQMYAAGDYKNALSTLLAGGNYQGAQLMGQQLQNDWTQKHTTSQDAINQQHWNASFGLQKQAADRAAYEFEHTPDQYAPNPRANEPGQPKYVDQYAEATAATQSSKPQPVETLGGTKFIVRNPGGGFSLIDPQNLPGMNGGAPSQPAQAGAQPPQAPGQPTQVPGQPAQAQPSAQPQPDLQAVDPTTGRREGYLQSLPPDVQDYVKKVADYEMDPRTSSTKGGHREQLMSAVAKYDPTYDQNTFSSRSKAIRDFATGTQGNSIRSFDVGISHLDILEKYITALNSGNYPAINSLRNAYLQQTGSPLPTNVQAVGPIVGAEVSKAIIGSNNALADREELRKPLLGNGAPVQILDSIKAYKELMGGQLRGLKKQYEDTTGKKNFNSRISDTTRNQLLGGDGTTVAPVTIDGYTIKEH